MASMDNIEGDALELGVLVAVALGAYLVWKAYTSGGSIAQSLANALRTIWNAIDSIFSGAVGSLSNAAHAQQDTFAQYDGATAYAGTDGTNSTGVIVPGYQNTLAQQLSGTIGG